MKTAAIFGAGNIGRGFIGQLLSESGYSLVFIDIDKDLLGFLNQHQRYDLQTVYNEDVHTYQIGPVRGLLASDNAAVLELLTKADIAATSVGPRALKFVVPHLARAVEARAARQAPPLNIILCENLKDAAAIVRKDVAALVPPAAQAYLRDQVGFVDPVIGRMVPPLTPELKKQNPGLIRVEPYKELPVDREGFRGPIPAIVGMQAEGAFGLYTARKLYIHNCGHALLAYAGYHHGFEYGYEAMDDSKVHAFLIAGWRESMAGIVKHYGADLNWLQDHARDLDQRFRNRALGDTIFRLGKDPARKLGPTDRLVAPARLALEAGVFPETLATGIALALRFDPEDDEVAVDLQAKLAAQGVGPVLQELSGITPDEPLGKFIAKQYEKLA